MEGFKSVIRDEKPNTKTIFKIFEPTILPINNLYCSFD